jgi:hypothetical protein
MNLLNVCEASKLRCSLIIEYMRLSDTELMHQVGLHGLRHTQVMIAPFAKEFLINLSQHNKYLIDAIDSQNGVTIIMPINDDL